MKVIQRIAMLTAIIAIAVSSCKKKDDKPVQPPTPAFVAVTDITGVPTTATAGTALTLTGTVAPATATNKTITWAVKTQGTTGATITGSTLNTTAAGTATVTATIANGKTATTPYTKDFTITVNAEAPEPDVTITIAAIQGVTPPVTDATPVSAITETEQYTGAVAWEPDDTEFEYGTAYTATITLTPKTGYTLAGVAANFFTVAGTSAPATNAAGSGVITAVFPATADAIINIPEIDGITAPVAGETPATAVTETEQFTGTVAWTPADAVFEEKVYTAVITLTAKAGYTLEGVPADFFIVDGANTVTNAANNGVVTAVFPMQDELPYLPEFTVHPINRTIAEGQDAPFTVTVTPGNPAETVYQWQMFFGGSWKILSDITDEISGANTRLLLLKSVSIDLNGAKLRCAVSNTAGEIISGEATLTVNPALALTLSASLLEFSSTGGTLSVNVITTTDWSAGTWFPIWFTSITPTSGTGNGTITITLPANSVMSARSTTVTVSGTGAVSKSFTIWQPGTSLVGTLNLSTYSLTIEGDGGSFYSKTFTVTTGVSWTAGSSATWLTVSPASGTGNGTVTVTATPNPSSTASRTAVITVGGDNTSPKTINVTQEWYPMVIVPTPDGSASNPFIVNSAATLQKVGSGTDGWTPDKHYRQTANITLSGLFTPINNFNGTYDGGGYFIDYLTISSSANNQGMFSRILDGGVVRNVALTGAYVGFRNDTWTVIGGIAGNNGGTIENCYVTGGIWGWNNVGGIAGFNAGVIQNCYTNCNVTANGNEDGYNVFEDAPNGVGGIAGRNALGTVRYCYATGKIKGEGIFVGGIVGYSNGDIDRCVAMNYEVNCGYWGWFGRVRGDDFNYGTLTKCYARESGLTLICNGFVQTITYYHTRNGVNAPANLTHGANSGAWWYDTGYSSTNWNCANNRLPHLKTTGGGAFSHTQTTKVQ